MFRIGIIKFLFFGLIVLGQVSYAQNSTREYQYALIEAVKQKNLGNIPGAIELYKLVINANDSVAVAHYELGNLLQLTGNKEDAEEHLKKAYESDKSNPWYFQSYIDVLIANEKFDTGLEVVKEVISIVGEKPEYLFRKADIYFRNGKIRKAIKSLEYIENNYGYSDKITMLKANIYESKGKNKKAMKEVEEIVSLFPESIEYKIIAAELATQIKDEDLAAKFYEDIFGLDSMNIFALTNLTDYYRKNGDLSKSFEFMNLSFLSDRIDYDRKIAILSYYLSDDKIRFKYQNELKKLIDTLIYKYNDKREIRLFAADFYIQLRDYNKALDRLLPVFNQDEKSYDVWKQGILLANAVDRSNEVIQLTNEATRLFPDSVDLYLFKAMAEFELKEYSNVIETIDQKLVKKLNNQQEVIQVKTLLAESYHQLKNFEKSDSLFSLIIEIDPTNYLVLNNFSYYLSLRGDSLEFARELSYKTIQHDPGNNVYLDTYAWILFKIGEYKEAEKYIRKALANGGENDPDVNEHAGDIHRKLGNNNLAEGFYKDAINNGGDRERLMDKINTLYESP